MSILINRKKSIIFSTSSPLVSLIVHSRVKCLRCTSYPRFTQSIARLAISFPVRKRSPYTTTLIATSGLSTKSPNSFPMHATDPAFPRPHTWWTTYRSINLYKSRLSPQRIKQNLCSTWPLPIYIASWFVVDCIRSPLCKYMSGFDAQSDGIKRTRGLVRSRGL